VKPFGERLPLAERYRELLADEGITWGLIGPREGERLWERHILNSLPVGTLIPEGLRVLDVGSGAGLPGIPLAIDRPDLQITLLEPLARRVTFLEHAVATLGLANVTILRGKAHMVSGRWPVVTGRAVAPLPRLVEWTLPRIEPGGCLLALKGENAEAEMAEARPALERVRGLAYALHHVERYGSHGWVIEVRRNAGSGGSGE
jgi:16S rRNA (guanine527-N7)-methyltransferase